MVRKGEIPTERVAECEATMFSTHILDAKYVAVIPAAARCKNAKSVLKGFNVFLDMLIVSVVRLGPDVTPLTIDRSSTAINAATSGPPQTQAQAGPGSMLAKAHVAFLGFCLCGMSVEL